MLINQFLEISAQKYSDKNAVWYMDKWMTYSEIDVLSNKVSNYLKENGIQRGDRVALIYENSFNYIIGYYAILKIGAITVALNTATTSEILTYLLNDSEAKAIITNSKFLKTLLPALKKSSTVQNLIINQEKYIFSDNNCRYQTISLTEIYEHGKDNPPNVRCIDVDLASIVYTSGSTGKPKGVTLSHLNIVSNTYSIVEYLNLVSDDRIMVILPFYYIYGKSLLNTHFSVGGSIVIDNRFLFPNLVLDTMKKNRVTGFSGVPSTFMILLNRSKLKSYNIETLRYVTQAGGPMAPAIQKDVVRIFKPAKLFIMYGATEASARLSYLNPEMFPEKLGSIGKAIPNVELFVADETGRKLPPEEIGEIIAKGSNLMLGYWNDPVETSKVIKNGYYYTRDLGKMDKDGYIYIVGRNRDIIKVSGKQVSAKEVEEAILEIKAIHEVAVIGVNDPVLGEAIKAFIVPKEKNNGLTIFKIKNYLKNIIPLFKIPKYFEFFDSLPKNESGKVLKKLLTEPNEA